MTGVQTCALPISETEKSAENLEAVLADLQEELKATKRQRIRDIMKHPDQEEALEETYGELESDLLRRMEGIQNQIAMAVDKRNTIIQVNRAAKTAMEVFDGILNKPKLDRNDLQLMIQRIKVYEGRIEIQLKADIDSILRSGELPVGAARGRPAIDADEAVAAMAPVGADIIRPTAEGDENDRVADCRPYEIQIIQESGKHNDKIFTVKVISNGDPLEIYTDKDGGVIFKKYSLMGGLVDFAGQLCETLNRTTGQVTVITDRDSCIAVAGVPRRELFEKAVSPQMERLMEGRQVYQYKPGEEAIPLCADSDKYSLCTAAPILSEGDVLGCVLFAGTADKLTGGEVEYKLVQSIAGFLGRHMES